MTYEAATAFLYSLERRGVRLGLDRVVGAFRDHGDPQESFASVLIAGTNGKGSTAAIAAACLEASGRRTGLFTSPHLIDFRERMRVNGRMIPRDAVADLTERIRGSADRWQLSYFEATTLIAFLWFRDSGVETAAVEVGLGGRLDATRPVRAMATCVTSIDLDHEKILGATREIIAAEKAGVFRSGVPVATGVRPAGPLAVLRRRAGELRCPFHERRRALEIRSIRQSEDGASFTLQARQGHPGPASPLRLELHLSGMHQIANASLAVLALCLLPPEIRPREDAIQTGVGRARWPGRLQRLSRRPSILVDVAHNPEGARSLERALVARGESDLRLVAGMVEGKDHGRFLRLLRPLVSHAYICAPRTDRAVPAESLAEAARQAGLTVSVHERPADALDAAISDNDPEQTILVAGSFYTVGEVMSHLSNAPDESLWDMGGPG